MGKVRPDRVKRLARELVSRFPDRFTVDFEANKKSVEALTRISSQKLRNRVAGYVTRLMSGIHREAAEAEETEEAGKEGEEEAETPQATPE